jgi:hypothetical protein
MPTKDSDDDPNYRPEIIRPSDLDTVMNDVLDVIKEAIFTDQIMEVHKKQGIFMTDDGYFEKIDWEWMTPHLKERIQHYGEQCAQHSKTDTREWWEIEVERNDEET